MVSDTTPRNVNQAAAVSESVAVPRGVEALLDSPYARYLNLEIVFDIQVAETEGSQLRHPEEVLFRTVHVSSELWLRLAGYELDRAVAAMRAGQLMAATRLARRAEQSITMVIEATGLLEGMAAPDYHQFRIYFGEASGLQSPGYAYVRNVCRAVATAFDALVGDDDALFNLYTARRDDPLYDLSEALLDLDAGLDRFRARHLQIARRFLGELTVGTGGTAGIEYLRKNMGHELFPRLWAVRDQIARASGAVSSGYGTPRP
jgi:tryptophan 2,3-dioxygenase